MGTLEGHFLTLFHSCNPLWLARVHISGQHWLWINFSLWKPSPSSRGNSRVPYYPTTEECLSLFICIMGRKYWWRNTRKDRSLKDPARQEHFFNRTSTLSNSTSTRPNTCSVLTSHSTKFLKLQRGSACREPVLDYFLEPTAQVLDPRQSTSDLLNTVPGSWLAHTYFLTEWVQVRWGQRKMNCLSLKVMIWETSLADVNWEVLGEGRVQR